MAGLVDPWWQYQSLPSHHRRPSAPNHSRNLNRHQHRRQPQQVVRQLQPAPRTHSTHRQQQPCQAQVASLPQPQAPASRTHSTHRQQQPCQVQVASLHQPQASASRTHSTRRQRQPQRRWCSAPSVQSLPWRLAHPVQGCCRNRPTRRRLGVLLRWQVCSRCQQQGRRTHSTHPQQQRLAQPRHHHQPHPQWPQLR